MAKKKKPPKNNSNSNGDSSSNKKTPDLTPSEAKKIIESEAREEAALILAELNLQLVNQNGIPLDQSSIKKILKDKYKVDYLKDKQKTPPSELSSTHYPVQNIVEIKVE